LTVTLAATDKHSDHERVVCLFATHWELVWDTHKWAHTKVQWVFKKLQPQWYGPRLGGDVRLTVRQSELC